MVENSQLPPEEAPVVEAPMEAKLIDELQKMEYEPLLPVEKKLIAGASASGSCLWASYTGSALLFSPAAIEPGG